MARARARGRPGGRGHGRGRGVHVVRAPTNEPEPDDSDCMILTPGEYVAALRRPVGNFSRTTSGDASIRPSRAGTSSLNETPRRVSDSVASAIKTVSASGNSEASTSGATSAGQVASYAAKAEAAGGAVLAECATSQRQNLASGGGSPAAAGTSASPPSGATTPRTMTVRVGDKDGAVASSFHVVVTPEGTRVVSLPEMSVEKSSAGPSVQSSAVGSPVTAACKSRKVRRPNGTPTAQPAKHAHPTRTHTPTAPAKNMGGLSSFQGGGGSSSKLRGRTRPCTQRGAIARANGAPQSRQPKADCSNHAGSSASTSTASGSFAQEIRSMLSRFLPPLLAKSRNSSRHTVEDVDMDEEAEERRALAEQCSVTVDGEDDDDADFKDVKDVKRNKADQLSREAGGVGAGLDGFGGTCLGWMRCTAVGLHYHAGDLTAGQLVNLVRERNNAYDPAVIRVMNLEGEPVGAIQRDVALVLAPLLDAGKVRLQATCEGGPGRGRSHSADLHVSVYGRPEQRAAVTNQLQRAGYPLEQRGVAEYQPQCDDSDEGDEAMQAARTLVSRLEPHQAVMERWQQLQADLPRMEPAAAVGSSLYPHQKQALGWMVAREKGEKLPPLWRRSSRGLYVHRATRTATSTRPAAVCGGILADDMGLGKTLQIIALILTHFRDDRPLAVPVPGRRRTPALQYNVTALTTLPKTTPRPPVSAVKVDWDDFMARLKAAAKVKPTPKIKFTDDGEEKKENVAHCGNPLRIISDEEDEDEPDPKRAKVGTPPVDTAGPPIDVDDLLDIDDGIASVTEPIPAAKEKDDEYIPFPPVYCDLDGRTESGDKPRTTLIVCPLSVLDNWEQQLEQHVHRNVHLRIRSFHGASRSVKDLKDADVIITTYGTLAREFTRANSPLFNRPFLRLVLDEAHKIRNPRTLLAKAAWEVRAERRWALTGTPVQNRLVDLWSLLRFLQLAPFEERPFWTKALEKPATRGEPLAVALLQQLMGALALRRLKDQMVDGKPIVELPARDVYVHHVTLSQGQRGQYDLMERASALEVLRCIRDGTVMRRQMHILVMLLRLRQVCCHPALVHTLLEELRAHDHELRANQPGEQPLSQEERARLVESLLELLRSGSAEECPVCFEPLNQPTITACGHVFCRPCLDHVLEETEAGGGLCPLCRGPLRRNQLVEVPEEAASQAGVKDGAKGGEDPDLISSAKMDALMQALRLMRREDARRKALVVSQFTSLLTLVEARLRRDQFRFRRLDGSMSLAERRRNMAEFSAQGADQPTVLLLSMRAGGEGINLTAASRVFLLDPAWNPAVEEQCFDRCHRLGQTQPVQVVKFVVRDSVEERMLELQETKRTLADNALGGRGQTPEQRRGQFIADMRTLFNIPAHQS